MIRGCIPCVPILPLSYDDSISYYEQLCKITNKINEIIDTLNAESETDSDTSTETEA